MNDTTKLLQERGTTHGEYHVNANSTWDMYQVLERLPGYATAPGSVRHAAYLIVHKLSRAFSGDLLFEDHWQDISGYAQCVVRDLPRMRGEQLPTGIIHDQTDPALGDWVYVNRYVKADRLTAARDASPVSPRGVDEERSVPGTPEDGGQHAAEGRVDPAPAPGSSGPRWGLHLTFAQYTALGAVHVPSGSERGVLIQALYDLSSDGVPDHYATMRQRHRAEYAV